MLLTPFDALATRNYVTTDILRKIDLAFVEQELVDLYTPEGNHPVKGVYGIASSNTDIPAFSHPIYHAERGVFVIDTRTLITTTSDGRQRLTNAMEYRYQLTRAMLNLHVLTDSPVDLINTGELGPLVFIRWLGGNLAKKLGLSPGDQIKVNVVSLFYWYSLFRDINDPFTEKDRMRIVTRLTQLTATPSNIAFDIANDIPVIHDIEEYCEVLKQTLDNQRIDMVSPAFIFALLGGSWFGMNVKETIAVATEHPPTFLAMVAEAQLNRSYRKTQIGTLVMSLDKKGRGQTFTRNLHTILEAHYD